MSNLKHEPKFPKLYDNHRHWPRNNPQGEYKHSRRPCGSPKRSDDPEPEPPVRNPISIHTRQPQEVFAWIVGVETEDTIFNIVKLLYAIQTENKRTKEVITSSIKNLSKEATILFLEERKVKNQDGDFEKTTKVQSNEEVESMLEKLEFRPELAFRPEEYEMLERYAKDIGLSVKEAANHLLKKEWELKTSQNGMKTERK